MPPAANNSPNNHLQVWVDKPVVYFVHLDISLIQDWRVPLWLPFQTSASTVSQAKASHPQPARKEEEEKKQKRLPPPPNKQKQATPNQPGKKSDFRPPTPRAALSEARAGRQTHLLRAKYPVAQKDPELKGDHLLAPLTKMDQTGKTKRSKGRLWTTENKGALPLSGPSRNFNLLKPWEISAAGPPPPGIIQQLQQHYWKDLQGKAENLLVIRE